MSHAGSSNSRCTYRNSQTALFAELCASAQSVERATDSRPDLLNAVFTVMETHNIDGFDTNHMDANFYLAQGSLEYADALRGGKIDHREERKLVKFWRRMKGIAGAMHHRLP